MFKTEGTDVGPSHKYSGLITRNVAINRWTGI